MVVTSLLNSSLKSSLEQQHRASPPQVAGSAGPCDSHCGPFYSLDLLTAEVRPSRLGLRTRYLQTKEKGNTWPRSVLETILVGQLPVILHEPGPLLMWEDPQGGVHSVRGCIQQENMQKSLFLANPRSC